MRRFILIIVPYLWLTALFLVPFAIVFKISLSDIAHPRHPALWADDERTDFSAMLAQLDFENFVFLTTDDLVLEGLL